MSSQSPGGRLAAAIDRERRRFLQTGAVGLAAGSGCLAGQFPASENPAEIGVGDTNAPAQGGEVPDAPVLTHTYTLDQAGQVSAAVYDGDGRILRTLLRAAEREAGEHTHHWDGLDRHGEPHDGDATIRVLRKPPFEAEFVTHLGVNPDSEPYHWWAGNHGPGAVALDGDDMFLGAVASETVPVLLKQSRDGDEQHWIHDRYAPWKGAQALAVHGDDLLMLHNNAKAVVVDPETGAERTKWNLLPDGVERSEETVEQHRPVDLAANDANLVTVSTTADRVRWLDGDGATAAEADVASPTAVAVSPAGGVYVASEKRVLEVTRSGATRSLVEGLVAPTSLAIDPAGGDILVAEGDPDHRVKRFARSGDLKRTYGREGGRQEGPYEPTDFRGVHDLTADGDGGFFVTEPHVGPRRTTHLDSDGQVIDDWYGGQPYFTWTAPDPDDPTDVWFNNGWGWITHASIDPDDGSWSVEETHDVASKAEGLMLSNGGPYYGWKVRHHDGERYLVGEDSPNVCRHADGELQPLVAAGELNEEKRETIAELTDVPDGANSYLWTDANDDGAMQGDEIEFFEHGTGLNDCWIAEDLTIVWSAGGDGKHSIYELTPEWEDGVPHYPDVRPSDPVGGTSLGRSGGTSSRGRGTFRDSDGNYYAHYRDRGERGDRHGAGWPTRWAGKNRLFRLDADGNEAWKIGRHAIHGGLGDHTVDTPPGYMHIPTGIVGEVQDTIAVCDRVETPGMIWTKDGLYAGSLFDSRADDGLPPMVYHWWRTPEGEEAITATDNAAEGTLVEYEDGGLWFAPGRQGSPVYRVRGWDGWSRDEGTVSVDEPPHAAAEGEGLNAAYFDSPALDGSPATERTDARVWGGVGRGSDGHSSVADGKKPVLNWTDGVDAVGKPTEFSVRWTGEVEAQLTEPFTFSTYQRGGVRLWIDGEQLIFGWNESRNRWETDPIPLTAGERVPVQLDFYTTRDPPACSLNWESPTQERERIPTDYLYPTSADVRTQPDARSATNRINPTTFDDTSDWFSARGDTIRVFGHYDSTQGGWIGYRRLDFGDGVSGIRIRARTNWGPPDIELRVGGPEGQPIGHVGGPKSTNGEYTMLEGEVDSISGVQDLYMVDLSKSGGQGLWMDWFTFE